MSPRSNPKAHRRRHFSWYLLHRYIGLLVAVFILLLAVTGLMLNHTEALRLDARKIHSPVVLAWYGVRADAPETGFQLAGNWISGGSGALFFNDRLLDIAIADVTGAVSTGELLVVSGREKLILLTPDGDLVDIMDAQSGLPTGEIKRLGRTGDSRIVLETEAGKYMTGPELLNWRQSAEAKPQWAQPQALPDSLRTGILQSWRGDGISLERLVLDLHSGRLFGGDAGVMLMDFAAVIMILLVLSGVWLWIARWRKRVAHKKAWQRHHAGHGSDH